jgi:hypothetical protein
MHRLHTPFAVLEHAIYRIITTYAHKLEQFEFPPLYAAKLQRFVDFSQ